MGDLVQFFQVILGPIREKTKIKATIDDDQSKGARLLFKIKGKYEDEDEFDSISVSAAEKMLGGNFDILLRKADETVVQFGIQSDQDVINFLDKYA